MERTQRESVEKIKKAVLERDNFTCQYCGEKLDATEATLEHIIPRSLGGNSSFDNLITACRYCNCYKANKTLKNYLIGAIKSNTEYYQTFISSLDSIRALMETSSYEKTVEEVFYRLLYSNIIAIMETYLSDAFINTVMKDKILIRRLIESDPEFQKRKLTISEIYTCLDKIENTVREYLLDIIYHNIWVVKNMYKCVLNIDFPEDMQEVNIAVMTRHDIVHRNGKSRKTGKIHEFSKNEVLKCIGDITKFINYIDSQLKILDSTRLGRIVKMKYLDLDE